MVWLLGYPGCLGRAQSDYSVTGERADSLVTPRLLLSTKYTLACTIVSPPHIKSPAGMDDGSVPAGFAAY
jgi:hypothetical protein